MTQNQKRKRNGSILLAFCLVLCLSATFVMTSSRISKITLDICFRTLRDSTRQFVREIRNDIEADIRVLNGVSNVIAGYREVDSRATRKLVAVCDKGSMLSSVAVLLPDGRMIRQDGSTVDVSGALSFEELAASGAHLTARLPDPVDPGQWVSYIVSPIVRDGQTAGLVCGIIDLESKCDYYESILAEARGDFFIFSAGSSQFIIDTLHDELGEVSSAENGRVKEGYDSVDALDAMILGGEQGITSMYSDTVQEYMYCVFEPVGVNDWIVMLTVPESVAFNDAANIRDTLYVTAIMEAVLFAAYLLLVLYLAKKEAKVKDDKLNRVQYMLKIEETLFNASNRMDLVENALEKVATMLGAEQTFLVIYRDGDEDRVFNWRSAGCNPTEGNGGDGELQGLRRLLRGMQGLVTYDISAVEGISQENLKLLESKGIKSIMMIPVKDSDSAHIGGLGAINMKNGWTDTGLLDCVMLSFSMAIKNIESFSAIEEMGNRDRLTGLKNRNSFQKAMEENEKLRDDSMACVYADADGLHDINNNFGHDAGDKLLQSVAAAIVSEFGSRESYRIGGDEFVVFAHGLSRRQVDKRIEVVKREVARLGYHVSIGVSWRSETPLVLEMVKQAEVRMFEAKREYYKNRGDEHHVREMNRELEEMLNKKRDLDTFKHILEYKYLGVYIVDLRLDTLRWIYIPDYFRKTVEASGGKFSIALKEYSRERVKPWFTKELVELLNYDELEKNLLEGKRPSLRFQKTDGTYVLLKIELSPDYAEYQRECVWTFEKN